MTKEPIMIDEVDVSGCECYNPNIKMDCILYPLQPDACKNNPNCHYKLYKRKEQEYNRLSNLITSTKTYEITCSNCRDAILTAPTISGRTKFSQIEVEESSLKNIIEQLKNKEQECEEWKNKYYSSTTEVKADLIKQLDQLKAKNEELKKVNIHIDNNRIVKAKKLKRIEDLIIACNSGYTDEFIQELLVILHEPEPSSFENKYKTALTEIKEICKQINHEGIYGYVITDEFDKILQKCEVIDK